MRVKVTKRGLVIPKDMLAGSEEVEIRKEDHRIVIALLREPDPIFDLGKNPVEFGVPDGAKHHDHYLYDCGS
jgi:hypothetical protein